MKVSANDALRSRVFDIMRKNVDRPRPINEIHASDCDGLCNLKIYYRRMLDPAPPLPEKTILFFASGICFEEWLSGGHPELVERDGIFCSADMKTESGDLIEIKATRSNLDKFKPETAYPWWITRLKTYCYGYGVNAINLVIFFWVGNRRDEQIGLRAWQYEFTPEELNDNWAEVQTRANILRQAFKSGLPIPPESVEVEGWEHRDCQFRDICYYITQGYTQGIKSDGTDLF